VHNINREKTGKPPCAIRSRAHEKHRSTAAQRAAKTGNIPLHEKIYVLAGETVGQHLTHAKSIGSADRLHGNT
jgi:hypothetical protein